MFCGPALLYTFMIQLKAIYRQVQTHFSVLNYGLQNNCHWRAGLRWRRGLGARGCDYFIQNEIQNKMNIAAQQSDRVYFVHHIHWNISAHVRRFVVQTSSGTTFQCQL